MYVHDLPYGTTVKNDGRKYLFLHEFNKSPISTKIKRQFSWSVPVFILYLIFVFFFMKVAHQNTTQGGPYKREINIGSKFWVKGYTKG